MGDLQQAKLFLIRVTDLQGNKLSYSSAGSSVHRSLISEVEFDPITVRVVLGEDKVAMGQVSFEYISFHLSVSIRQCSILIHSSITDAIILAIYSIVNP